MNHGFVRVAAAVPPVKAAGCAFNSAGIEKLIRLAQSRHVQVLVFPELCVTGYTCGDLFAQRLLLTDALAELARLLKATSDCAVLCAAGLPLEVENGLYNCAVLFQKGRILAVIPKTYLANYNEFYEKRWFSSALDICAEEVTLCGQTVPFGTDILLRSGDICIGVEICEDLWVPVPPSCDAAMAGANILLNLSASNELIGKHEYVVELVTQQSARCQAAYVYAGAGFGESSTDAVFAGNGLVSESGTLLAVSQRFSLKPQLTVADVDVERLQADRLRYGSFTEGRVACDYLTVDFELADGDEELLRVVSPLPFLPGEQLRAERCREILEIQSTALAQRLAHTQAKSAVIGVSGGLDSTLALLAAVSAFDKLGLPRNQIIGVSMPGFGTTGRTYRNGQQLMKELGVSMREISINLAVNQHFKDIGHDPLNHNVTYENSQARERTQILMDIANQTQGLVIGTGDLSELALGWATYNGDHMSMYGVNSGVPKTLVRAVTAWYAAQAPEAVKTILLDILDTPVSPELVPADEKGVLTQKTEDLVGPYELHDFFLYYFLRFGFRPAKIYYLAKVAFKERYDKDVIKKWLTVFFRRFFAQQFKRSCMPDGPKVGSVCLSPRADWRMPSDASWAGWERECENL